ncbi:DUF4930 family protein [Staphylococcus hominis]|uniref:DUF4930 family protein n=1 Tax=Staphylococcus hominis TaxID=1290 RepID=UPI001F577371|nr:DUF4930 family protein [Staphylococcus hominis]MCI2898544.1 DUF4930 family protein [Staphylococcus hominis]
MRMVFSIFKNIVAVIAILSIVYFALKYAPFLREQDWNPMNQPPNNQFELLPSNQTSTPVLTNGKSYTIEENRLLQNIPASQTKNVFKFIDKKEFMEVSGIVRMGYNDNYIVGQRDNEFIIYKFGSDTIKVFSTEIEMEQELNRLGQSITLKPRNEY